VSRVVDFFDFGSRPTRGANRPGGIIVEADNIRAALKAANGKVSGPSGASKLLGLKPTTLVSRIKVLGILPKNPRASG
jgi:transcriptional regulator with GAF, ATPase, and Fis domain